MTTRLASETRSRGVPGGRPPGQTWRALAAGKRPKADDHPSPLDARCLHPAEFAFEFLDLVAEAGRGLELELRGGRVHLLGELADQRHQVTAGLAPGAGRRL